MFRGSPAQPSGDAYGFQECLYTRTKDKTLPLLWIRDEPRLLPWRNLGSVLESAPLLTLEPLPRRRGRGNVSSEPDTGSPGAPVSLASFSAHTGRVLFRWSSHSPGGIPEPFSNSCGLLSPILCSSPTPPPLLPDCAHCSHSGAVKTYPGLPEGQLWLYAVPGPPDLMATPGPRPQHAHPWVPQPWCCLERSSEMSEQL